MYMNLAMLYAILSKTLMYKNLGHLSYSRYLDLWISNGADIVALQGLETQVSMYMSLAAGLGGSVGCAVQLETRRSWVQPPSRLATFFRED